MASDRLLGGSFALVAASVLVAGAGIAMAYDAGSEPVPPVVAGAPGVVAAPLAPGAAPSGGIAVAVDPYQAAAPWVAATATAARIPVRALSAYAGAQLQLADEQPECRVGWNTLAAIGSVESGHGSAGEAVLGDDGVPSPAILGPALDGTAFAAIRDTDGGLLDGDLTWDRAVGPLQFIPSTWAQWAADGNGDGVADPHQIDDAALAAARYLCHSGDLSDPATWRRAVFSYNHSDPYVADVAATANAYASRAG